ncbi:MAG: glycosyltransferase family 87 protein, partial [Phycisphaerae bacterium]
MSAARQRRLLWIGRGVVMGFACFCAVYYGALFVRGKYQDWHHLYHAMQAVMQGTNPYEAGIKCYLYPPMFAVVFSPLGLLSEGVSGFVFACVSAALLVLALVWISRETCRLLGLELDPWRVWAVAATGLLFNVDKLRAVIYSGQSDHVILALLAGAFITVRKRPFVAGVLLGLSAVIKFQTVAFLAYFVVRRRWRECVGMITGIAAGLLAGVPVFGWTTNWQYVATSFRGVATLVGKAQAGVDAPPVNPLTWWASVSIPSAVARMTGYPANTALLAAIVAACAAGCVAVVAWLYGRCGAALFAGRGGASERVIDT